MKNVNLLRNVENTEATSTIQKNKIFHVTHQKKHTGNERKNKDLRKCRA